MSGDRRWDSMLEMARRERAPAVDVTRDVMARIREARGAEARTRPLVWVAGVALAIAIPLLLAAPYALRAFDDPLLRMFVDASWGLP